MLEGEALDQALNVAADFIDLKSPYMGGHSRRCAQIAADAARLLGLSEEVIDRIRRSALVHDFGITAVPNSIWDKPGELTRTEFDRVELHPMLTEQMLRRSPALAALNPVAAAHHEKCDGSGYHRRARADTSDLAACVLAATEVYVGLTAERADRAPFSADDAAAELRRLEAEAVLEPRATRAVLVAVGHGEPAERARRRPDNPGGLSRREVDVLGLAARGLTTRQIADRLVISPKTADATSRTSTARSGCRRAPPPPCGRCSTTSFASDGHPRAHACVAMAPGWVALRAHPRSGATLLRCSFTVPTQWRVPPAQRVPAGLPVERILES